MTKCHSNIDYKSYKLLQKQINIGNEKKRIVYYYVVIQCILCDMRISMGWHVLYVVGLTWMFGFSWVYYIIGEYWCIWYISWHVSYNWMSLLKCDTGSKIQLKNSNFWRKDEDGKWTWIFNNFINIFINSFQVISKTNIIHHNDIVSLQNKK